MKSQYFIRRGTQVSGPLSGKELKEQALSGRVAAEDEISQDEQTWVAAAKVRGLRLDVKPNGPPGSNSLPERPFDAFISYSSQNKLEADTICGKLEALGIRCWIAPRDILPGTEWAEGIIEGIDASRVMVLVFSEHANNSPQVRREVGRSMSRQLPIIPFRVQNTLPTHALEYCLGNMHWLDAFDPPLERHVEYLATVVRRIVGAGQAAREPVSATVQTPRIPVAVGKLLRAIRSLAAVAALLIVGLLAAWPGGLFRDGKRKMPIPQAPELLENLLVPGSVWKGIIEFPDGKRRGHLEIYVLERASHTFTAIHVYRFHQNKPARYLRRVQGAVTGTEIQYKVTNAEQRDRNITGTWNGAALEITFADQNGTLAEGKLQRQDTPQGSEQVVFSLFDAAGTEGWYTLNQDDSPKATYPIKNDSVGSHHWLTAWPLPNRKEFGWHAPSRYHGNHSGKFGRYIIYSLWSENVGHLPSTDWYVRLRGGGTTLYVDGTTMAPPASKTWTTYCVRLDSSAGWKKFGSGDRASDEDIKNVLGALTDLRIKGEFGQKAAGGLAAVEFGAVGPYAITKE